MREIYAFMTDSSVDEFIDLPTQRLLMKKTWCHGQVIAPFQGMALAYWGATASGLEVSQRAILISSVVLLPVWTITTWYLFFE